MAKRVYLVFTILLLALMLVCTALVSAFNSIDGPEQQPFWATPLNLSQNDGSSEYSLVLRDELGNVHVLWRDNSQYPFNTRLFYRLMPTNGEWSNVETVPDSLISVGVPDAVTDSAGTLHVVWRGEGAGIVYASRPISGPWTPPTALSNSQYNDPDIEIGPTGSLHVIWGHGAYSERSPNGTWSSVTSAFDGINNQGPISIAVDQNGVVHAVVGDTNTKEIYYANHILGGPWSAAYNVSDNLTPSEVPYIAVDEVGGVHFAWKDIGSPGNWEVFYRALIGGAWTATKNVSNLGGESYRIRLKVSPNGRAHVLWNEHGADIGFYYASGDENSGWSAPRIIPGTSGEFAISEEGDVHILSGDSTDLYHSWLPPNGAWSPIASLQTAVDAGYISLYAGPAHSLHATWSEKTSYSSNSEVMYSSFEAENAPPSTPSPSPTPTPLTRTLYLPAIKFTE